MKVVTMALMASTPLVVSGSCRDDLGCSLNGVCVNNECVCDPGWKTEPSLSQGAPECGMLDLAPAPSYESFHGLSEATSSWGGSVLPIPDGKGHKYAMFAAEMTQNCTLRHWTTNSEVVLAVADSPTGPYTEQFQIIQPWAHNPEAIATTDGHVVVFTLGNGIPIHGPEVNCNNQTEREEAVKAQMSPVEAYQASKNDATNSAPAPAPGNGTADVQFTLHYAPIANGAFADRKNWNFFNATIKDFPVDFQFQGNWNPAPVQLPDGRVRVMAHTGWSGMAQARAGWSGEVIIEADSWRGPYTLISSRDITTCTFCEEDPYMWQDHRGNWHVLYHRMFDNGTNIKSTGAEGLWSGAHSYSKDGLHWSPITRCYNTTVFLEGGGSQSFASRERPKLLLNGSGYPTHLSNAVQPFQTAGPDAGITHTLLVPLNLE